MAFLPFLHQAADRRDLTAEEAHDAMMEILSGEATTAQIAAFLTALRVKGETAAEITGFARAMREKSVRVDPRLPPGEPLIDTCGAGGDGGGTFNISTIAAFVVAGAGVRVAKHGNRSLASRCGSADLLEALGVNLNLPPERSADAIREIGIGFFFAPAVHPAMKYAQPARAEIKMRTAFNLLGPLTNPAGARTQLIGAPSLPAARLLADALAALGASRALVVHGADGLDEISTTAETHAFDVRDNTVRSITLTPEDFGVPRALLADLQGGDPQANAAIAHAILNDTPGPPRDIVLVNAAAALVVAGKAANWAEGMALAARAVTLGTARMRLTSLAAFAV